MQDYPNYQYEVFFSFSNEDISIAKRIWTYLTHKGLKVFWSESTLKKSLGQSWYDKLEESLEYSRHFMVLFTPHALKSEWVRREYKAFLNFCYKKDERRLIPLLSGNIKISDLPLFLREFQVYYFDHEEDLESIFQLIAEPGQAELNLSKDTVTPDAEGKTIDTNGDDVESQSSLDKSIASPIQYDDFVDPRDDRKYRTVKINNQVWLAENLAFKTPDSLTYNNLAEYENLYGRLYSWHDIFKACPKGCQIPDQKDWDNLIYYLGGFDVAGGKMKDCEKNLWKKSGHVSNNSSGFSALPAGMGVDNLFGFLGKTACFWSNHEYDKLHAWRLALHFNNSAVQREYREKTIYLSVRCIIK